MKRLLLFLGLILLVSCASAASTLYLLNISAKEPIPNAKQSTDTIHRDLATIYATYANPGVMSELQGSIPTTTQSTVAEAGAAHYTHYGTWVSNPLASQWVNGTATVYLSMYESSNSANVLPRLKLYKWFANDTKGAELRTIGNSATEVGTSYPVTPVRYFNAVALTSTWFDEGDRITAEIESYDNNAVTTSWGHGIRYGGGYGYNSNVTFSQTLKYAPPQPTTSFQGTTTIKDTLLTKQPGEIIPYLLSVTDTTMGSTMFPYVLSRGEGPGSTELDIIKYRCDEKMSMCGYWIAATRGGEEVATNSPIWISPPPYVAVVSETLDQRTNERIIVLKEDPKIAVEQTLQTYVDLMPLGKAVVGTPG